MKNRALFVLVSGLLLLTGQTFGQSYTFLQIDVSCNAASAASDCPAGLVPGQVAVQTTAKGINAVGDIVGAYVAGGKQRGFLLKDGLNSILTGAPLHFTTIEFPGQFRTISGGMSVIAGVRNTIVNAINPQGEIVGQYLLPVNDPNDPNRETDPTQSNYPYNRDPALYCPANLPDGSADAACIKAFHYARGKFTTILFSDTVDPDGTHRPNRGAIAQRITPNGDIYGCLHDHDLGPSMFGAAWKRYRGKDKTVVPAFSLTSAGGEVSDPMGTPMSMNNGGTPDGQTIIGFFMNMANQQHGYVVQDGMLQTYDPTAATNLTAIWDINPNQQFVGTFREAGEPGPKRHGFLQNPDGSAPVKLDFTFQDASGNTVTAFATIIFGVNPDGVVVGQYTLVANGPVHGFVAVPASNAGLFRRHDGCRECRQ